MAAQQIQGLANREPADVFARLRPVIRDVDARARAVDIRAYERGADGRFGELARLAGGLLRETRELVAAVLAACEELRPTVEEEPLDAAFADPFMQFERALEAAVEAGGASPLQGVEDVAFLVQLELRQRGERLERLGLLGRRRTPPPTPLGAALPTPEPQSALNVLGECDSVLRRVRKGLGAIDLAIARFSGTEAQLDFSRELDDALRARESYAKFRERLLASGESVRDLRGRMRAAGTQIAVLVGSAAYPLLRVRDRLQLREIQDRILSWLRTEDHDPTAGERVWQDLVSFVEMLRQINRRQELVEHDAGRVVALLPEVERCAREGRLLGPSEVAGLASLRGADDALDDLISAEAAAPPARALAVLRAQAVRLGVRGSGS